MDFNVKLQELRKQRKMTQEEVAEALFVSRTAVSKWESGRGYPNLESLKAIAKLFSVSVDELLSGEELIIAVQEENNRKTFRFLDLVFGLLDVFSLLVMFLPVFAQRGESSVQAVALVRLSSELSVSFYVLIVLMGLTGIAILAFQNAENGFWVKYKYQLSLLLNALTTVWFVVCLHPYAAIYLFVFLVIKVLLLVKKR